MVHLRGSSRSLYRPLHRPSLGHYHSISPRNRQNFAVVFIDHWKCQVAWSAQCLLLLVDLDSLWWVRQFRPYLLVLEPFILIPPFYLRLNWHHFRQFDYPIPNRLSWEDPQYFWLIFKPGHHSNQFWVLALLNEQSNSAFLASLSCFFSHLLEFICPYCRRYRILEE